MVSDSSATTKAGHFLAKILGIKLQPREPFLEDVTRGESVISYQSTQTFVEEQPTTAEFFRHLCPTGHEVAKYLLSLFPFLSWIGFYNLQWLSGDLVAGITIGAVVVPQGMAYAITAGLAPQFGLYTSFMGVLIYWFFGTSKDITIGPVAVLSQVTGNVIRSVATQLPDVPAYDIAGAVSVLAGAIVCFIGLIRCGWIVDMIPLTSLSAFMTGCALSIAVGQLPGLMGITGITTSNAPYLVFINFLQGLPRSKRDAAMGLTALTMLYTIRSACNFAARRWPQHKRLMFFLSTLRTVFVILLYTMISWLVNMHVTSSSQSPFKILGTVPRGFQHAAVPTINTKIASALAGQLPSVVIVMLIEHMAISKSFGRVNNYRIDPSQEMVAIGVTNLLGPFLGAYGATGSFSRTAIKSKAGVRTPFAGVITAIVVLLAIYALPAVFFYIPSASLSAVVIHAVGDLITPPNTLYQFWRVSPLEVLVYFVGVLVTVFSSIENGIYCTIALSAAILLVRILKARGSFLGRVKVQSVLGDRVLGENQRERDPYGGGEYGSLLPSPAGERGPSPGPATRNIFLPINHGDGSNPDLSLENPYPGIFIYRFTEGFNYPNASHHLEYMTAYIFAHTRRTNPNTYERPGDRPWNDPGPRRRERKAAEAAVEQDPSLLLPTLKAVILDFSSVNHVDSTSVQQMIDVRNQLDRYAAPDTVDWHVACIRNRWTKRALLSAGFGYPSPRARAGAGDHPHHRWQSIFDVAEIGGEQSAAAAAESEANEKNQQQILMSARRKTGKDGEEEEVDDIEVAGGSGSSSSEEGDEGRGEEDLKKNGGGARRRETAGGRSAPAAVRTLAVNGLNRPLFHVDLTSALQSAIINVEARAPVLMPSPAPQ